MNKDLKVGDKVLLSEYTTWDTSWAGNPLNTVGEVVGVDEYDVEVLWSNGRNNLYCLEDFDLILQERVMSYDFIYDLVVNCKNTYNEHLQAKVDGMGYVPELSQLREVVNKLKEHFDCDIKVELTNYYLELHQVDYWPEGNEFGLKNRMLFVWDSGLE